MKLATRSLSGWVLPVARHAGEGYLQVVAVRADGSHMDSLPRLSRPDDHRPGGEVEGYAQHVGVLDVELVVLVQVIGLAPERPPHNLLAQQLRAKGADARARG